MAERIRRREGDWFAVPLAAGGFAFGLVARAPRRGTTLFGYFFGPIRSELPGPADIGVYRPDDAVRVCRFFDAPLVSGRWPIVAATEGWDRTAWPMPEFSVELAQKLLGQGQVVTYAEDDPGRYVRHRAVSIEEASRYPPDSGAFPAEHLEHNVGEWLGAPHIEDEVATRVLAAIRAVGLRQYLADPEAAVAQIGRQSFDPGIDATQPSLIAHFLMFPSRMAAGRAAKDLASRGFTVNRSYTAEFADEKASWLVVERIDELADLDKVEALLSDLAARHHGQYDGWEVGPRA